MEFADEIYDMSRSEVPWTFPMKTWEERFYHRVGRSYIHHAFIPTDRPERRRILEYFRDGIEYTS